MGTMKNEILKVPEEKDQMRVEENTSDYEF